MHNEKIYRDIKGSRVTKYLEKLWVSDTCPDFYDCFYKMPRHFEERP